MTNVDFRAYKRIVQYFYDPEPKNVDGLTSPIWCLGQRYSLDQKPSALNTIHTPPQDSRKANMTHEYAHAATTPESIASSFDSSLTCDEPTARNGEDGGWPAAFLDDFEAKLWFSYRSNFPAIPKSQDPKAASAMTFSARLRNYSDRDGFTSDTGFGCMIRSGQSLLANSILTLRLGRVWRRGQSKHAEMEILSLFADDPAAPFSIHRFVQHGASACGKYPGEWFGPSATARCIQELTDSYKSSDIKVYLTGDGSDVYVDSLMGISKADGERFMPTLILVGTRLGIDKITPAYYEALAATLKMPQSIGIAGGRPSASHYFLGVQGDNFFYLDPHYTKSALPLRADVDDYTDAEVSSCHTRRLRLVNVQQMDPSMLIGFLIRDEEDWHDWRRNVTSAQGKAIIHIADTDPASLNTSGEREGAIDEVESFDGDDDDEDEDETVLDRQTF
ncbi:MAG: Cysteine protease atg4 [Claussenomyces sp. TS43310]|nr:MAG: Cysteine protease atg4 [Claussenomyces sp. TS43310]